MLYEKSKILYWTHRLSLRPDEIQELSPEELNCRLQLVEERERAQELRMAKFKRWQNLCELRWLMYEVQREFNVKHGQAAIGVSIWRILALEQNSLEAELQLDELRGSCQRFPSPMSMMVPECEPDEKLKPLRSMLTGLSSQKNELRTPFTDALYEQERQLREEREFGEESATEKEATEEQMKQVADLQSSSSARSLSSLDLQEDLLDIHLELQNIKRSTARCDWIMDALFASHGEREDLSSQSQPSDIRCYRQQISWQTICDY
ncbi:uncharacterized protein LOC132794311 [Drosophila nasuta]|uniref:uncharacterized protein LOC132794311 n=1 Tax=Drosophila nasuta TaxID=42062 RepID=UPI00295E716F|nr:uncharacterized protein LOC132794311 [Drosophila nasuta]